MGTWPINQKPDDCGLPHGKWLGFDPALNFQIPRYPGVYVIYFDGVAVYVGQSSNLRVRLAKHAIRPGYGEVYSTPWGPISHAVNVTGKMRLSVRYGDWAMWELRLIRRLRPKFNATFVNPERHVA